VWTPETLEEVYRKHGYAVFRRCRALLRQEADAHDATQEVFVQLLERGDEFEGRSSVSTFLYAIATHLCLRRLRNLTARGVDWTTRVSYELDSGPTSSAEGALAAIQLWRAVLSESDETTAQLAVYHFADGLAQGEIAALVGLSRVTVNQRLQRFRTRARRLAEDAP
jgi:RNA polymerase sigma-70 factor (ECF subfamily)